MTAGWVTMGWWQRGCALTCISHCTAMAVVCKCRGCVAGTGVTVCTLRGSVRQLRRCGAVAAPSHVMLRLDPVHPVS